MLAQAEIAQGRLHRGGGDGGGDGGGGGGGDDGGEERRRRQIHELHVVWVERR